MPRPETGLVPIAQRVCKCGHVRRCHAGPGFFGACSHHPACGCECYRPRHAKREYGVTGGRHYHPRCQRCGNRCPADLNLEVRVPNVWIVRCYDQQACQRRVRKQRRK